MQPSVATMAPGSPAILVPTKVALLTPMGPGGDLRDGDDVGKFRHGQPSVHFHDLRLNEGQRGVSAADAE